MHTSEALRHNSSRRPPPSWRLLRGIDAGRRRARVLQSPASRCLLAFHKFDAFLRPSEMINMRPHDVSFLNAGTVIQLGLTKGVQQRGGVEEAVIKDPLLAHFLWEACRRTLPGSNILCYLLYQFQAWFRKCLLSLGLHSQNQQL